MERDYVLGIDPGKALVGWATVSAMTKQLLSCGLARGGEFTELMRDLYLGVRFNGTSLRRQSFQGVHVVAELPVYYKQKSGERHFVDPNDLIAIAPSSGGAVALFAADGASSEFVSPSTWKGQRPKDVHNRYVMGLLKPEETALVDGLKLNKELKHNVIDAVGIAFWKVGRK